MNTKRWWSRAAAALVSCCVAVGALAQTYPNKPVKLVVGYAPGGGPDLVARALAQKLTQSLGQPFVVENRAGAAATIATSLVAKSPADGYTLLLGETAQLAVAPHIYRNLNYDPVKDLAPVALMITGPLLLVASGKTTQIKSLEELVREAKARPGQLDYGTVGVGSIHHIAMETLKSALGLSVSHVPYKGGALTVSALVAGEVPLILTSISSLGQHSNHSHLLAVTSRQRYPLLPDVPAVSEVVRGFDFSSQMGVLAPARTPPDVIARLAEAIRTATHSPDFLEKLKTMGFAVTWGMPEEYADNIRQELAKYARAVKVANLQPE